MTPDEYRAKHRSCSTCEYVVKIGLRYKCNVKNKDLGYADINRQGIFCRIYKPKKYRGVTE